MKATVARVLAAVLVILFASVGAGFAQSQLVDLVPFASITDVPRISVPFTIEVDILNDTSPGVVAGGVSVTDVLPAGATLVSYSVAGYVQRGNIYDGSLPYAYASATNHGNILLVDAGNIPFGFSRRIWITLMLPSAGIYSHQISVSSPNQDVRPWNDTLVHSFVVHSNSLFVLGGRSASESSGTSVVFDIGLSPASSSPVTVEYLTVNGTATAGEDYTPVSGKLTFEPGVTNLQVEVGILDDLLAETPSQSFRLELTNSIGAEISGVAQPNFVLDDEPPCRISLHDAAPVVEGDTVTNLVFPVTLSLPLDETILVDFSSVSGAVTNGGTLIIPPGTTNTIIEIPVVGDLLAESNRTVATTLVWPRPLGEIAQGSAQGAILEDDGVPGKFDHMRISTVRSAQIAGRPFPVTLWAMDAFDQPATNFFGPVELAAYNNDAQPSQFVQTISVTNFADGVAVNEILYPAPVNRAVIVAWKPVGTYYSTASTDQFKVIASPPLFLALPGTVNENDGVLQGAGVVSITNLDGLDLLVNLASSDEQELIVPPSVMIPAGQTSAVFNITVLDDARLDPTHVTVLTAAAPGYIASGRSVVVRDNESATLSLALPPEAWEVTKPTSMVAVLTISRPPDWPVTVSLSSSLPGRLYVPCCVTFQPGQTSATFAYAVPDNSVVDGDQVVTVSAHVDGWFDATAIVTVHDNDPSLSVGFTRQLTTISEGSGVYSNGLLIYLSAPTNHDLTVLLASSQPTKVSVPQSVLVAAGARQVFADITFPDNNLFDGTQIAAITAVTTGYFGGAITFTVLDNDPYDFSFGPIAAVQTSGVPFQVQISALDVDGQLMTQFAQPVSLAAVLPGGAGERLQVSPGVASDFRRGMWFGSVVVSGWGTNVQLSATATNRQAGLSNPFDVRMPDWAADLRFSRWRVEGNQLELFFNSYTGRLYQLESATNLLAPIWMPAGPAVPGSGGEVRVAVPQTPSEGPLKWYRLAVPE